MPIQISKSIFLKSHLILKDGEEESITETAKEPITKTTLPVASTR
jgi:hypothetical protein